MLRVDIAERLAKHAHEARSGKQPHVVDEGLVVHHREPRPTGAGGDHLQRGRCDVVHHGRHAGPRAQRVGGGAVVEAERGVDAGVLF